MGDLVTFSTTNGMERFWVPRAEEAEWIARFGRAGIAAARWRDYVAWGRMFYPPTDDVISRKVMLRKPARKRTNYARWHQS